MLRPRPTVLLLPLAVAVAAALTLAPPTPRADSTIPARPSCRSTFPRWWGDTPNLAAMSAAEICRVGSDAASRMLHNARLVFFCSLIRAGRLLIVSRGRARAR